MRNTLVLSVRGSLPAGAPGESHPPMVADADAGPLAASHMPDTDAEALMPRAPNLNTVPLAADDPRRRGPSADAGGDEIVGDSMAVAEAAAAAPTVSDLRRRVLLAAASLQDRSGDDIGLRRRRRRRRRHTKIIYFADGHCARHADTTRGSGGRSDNGRRGARSPKFT